MPFIKGRKKTGGKMKGSKHKETLKREALRDFLIQEVIKEKIPLTKALIEKGKLGEVQALKEIFDRVLGKTTESLDITSGGDKIYNWQPYGTDNDLQPKNLDSATPRGEEIKQENGDNNQKV